MELERLYAIPSILRCFRSLVNRHFSRESKRYITSHRDYHQTRLAQQSARTVRFAPTADEQTKVINYSGQDISPILHPPILGLGRPARYTKYMA